MEFFRASTHIPFMRMKNNAFILSITILLLSILCVTFRGLSLSLDFTGGNMLTLSFPQNVSTEYIRSKLPAGKKQAGVQMLGGSQKVLIKLPLSDAADKLQIESIMQLFPEATLDHNSYIGPQVGEELLLGGVNAIVFALLFTMIYIALRFEYRFAVSAIVALLHDPIVTLGIFSLLQIEFDLITLAGVLTILGYSLNDTIVVYDRIKENFTKNPYAEVSVVVDTAINETLSRTIITSGLTFLAVLSLCVFGGPSLWGFSLSLAIGIIVGTYSSIYVAGALAVLLGLQADSLLTPVQRREEYQVLDGN